MNIIKKYNKYIKKQTIYIVLFLILIIGIQTKVFGAEIELRDDPEMDAVVITVVNWYTDNPQATESEVAKQIDIACGGDIEKIRKLQNTYTDHGAIIWPGGNTESIFYKATDIAIIAKEKGQEVESGNQNEKEELYNKIISMQSKLVNNQMSVDELKQLDNLLGEYKNKYGLTDSVLRDMALSVREKLRAAGETGPTTADEDSIRQEEHENVNSKPTGTDGLLGSADTFGSYTPDKIIENAQDFKGAGNATIPIDKDNVKNGSDSLFNILLSIGVFLSVAIGMYLGVKFMLANAEDKAKIKESLIPYIAGCIVIFGAFAIWKLAIILLSGIK